MTDISLAIPFVAVTPCRIADTRGLGFTGQAGPPILDTGTRTFQISGTVTGVPSQCGIPIGADAVSFQFTIVSPNTNGNLIAWPAGGAVPTISVLNWSAGETALGNGTIVPLSGAGALSVRFNAAVGSAVGHLVVDVNGYFADDQATGQYFEVTGSRDGPIIHATNFGVGLAVDALSGGNGVRGRSTFTAGVVFGVVGVIASPATGAAAVSAEANAEMGSTYGVRAINNSNEANSAAVYGRADDTPNTSGALFSKAGVRGESRTGAGAIGISEATGVAGFLMDGSDGTLLAQGRLGANFGGNYAVHGVGNFASTGTKMFLEPHPTDPTRVVQYIALEGPEAGTYFRGRAKFQRSLATIPVPESFRMVTDPEGLTVQITPIGELATFAVLRIGLDQIVVKASRDVEFSYLVQGVRASFKDVLPIVEDRTFLPQSADARMPSGLADRQKRVLVENGTYNADGTVNPETARRLGWDRMWASDVGERRRP
jgi:hypothetical protein